MEDEDVLDLGTDPEQDDYPEQSSSLAPTSGTVHSQGAPSENELRLGRRLLEVERERDELAAELEKLRANQATSTTRPITTSSSSSTSHRITIPQDILPTLTILRKHISDLTRDNEALRYTFLGQSTPASSSQTTLDTPMSEVTLGEPSHKLPGLDLEAVVKRVKELIRENEELGEMVLEAGRGHGPQLESALNESKAVIASLETDLNHHLEVVLAVRAELVAYKTHFGPIPKDTPVVGPSETGAGTKRDEKRHHRREESKSRNERRESVKPKVPPDGPRQSGHGSGQGSGQGHGRRESTLPGAKGTREEDREFKRRR